MRCLFRKQLLDMVRVMVRCWISVEGLRFVVLGLSGVKQMRIIGGSYTRLCVNAEGVVLSIIVAELLQQKDIWNGNNRN